MIKRNLWFFFFIKKLHTYSYKNWRSHFDKIKREIFQETCYWLKKKEFDGVTIDFNKNQIIIESNMQI